MRLERVFVERFGPIQSRDLSGLSPGLNIVAGATEEQLDAFRDFVRQVLFGFEGDGGPASASLSAPSGGVVEIVGSDGSPLTVERRLRGPAGTPGQLVVTAAGESRPDTGGDSGLAASVRASWAAVSEVTPGLFRQPVETLIAEIASLLSGADGANVRAVLQRLEEDEAAAIRAIDSTRSALRAANDRYARASAQFDEYATVDGQRAETRRQLAGTDVELPVVRARRERVETLEANRAAWSRMHELQAAMSGMPRYAFLPADPLGHLEGLRRRDAGLRSEIDLGDAEEATRSAELGRLSAARFDAFPLAESKRLLARRKEYEEAVRDSPVLAERLRELEERLAAGLRGLGHGWNEDGLGQVRDSPVIRDRLRKLDSGIAVARSRFDDLMRASDEADARLESARDAALDATRRLEAFGVPPEATTESVAKRLDGIARARSWAAESENARRSLDDTLARAVAAKPPRSISAGRLIPLAQLGMSAGFAVVGAVVWLMAAAAGDSGAVRTGQVVGITGVIGALMSMAILEVQRRHSRAQYEASEVLHVLARRAAEELEKEIAAKHIQLDFADAGLRSTLDELNLPRDLPVEQLDVERERATTELDRLKAFDGASSAAERALETQAAAVRDAREAGEAANAARELLDALTRDWTSALGELRLGLDLGLDAVIASLDLVAELGRTRAEVRELRVRVPAFRVTIVEVEAGLSEIAGAAGLPEFAASAAGPVLEQLEAAREEAARIRDRAAVLRRQGEAWAARREAAERELASISGERAELLDLAGADDEAAFREVAGAEQERRSMSAELERLRHESPHLTGPSGVEIDAELRESGPEALAAERITLTTRVERLEELQARLAERAASLDERAAELSGPPETLDCRIEINQLGEALGNLEREAATVREARRLLSDAMSAYRACGQPRRLELVGEYLARVTEGALVQARPLATSGDHPSAVFEIVSLNGSAESIDTLGADLARQVLLATKLAVAQERAESGEPVPVLVHDPAGGDAGAPRRIAAAVEELARHTQVLLLTNHPSAAADWAPPQGAASPGPRVFNLGAAGHQIRLTA